MCDVCVCVCVCVADAQFDDDGLYSGCGGGGGDGGDDMYVCACCAYLWRGDRLIERCAAPNQTRTPRRRILNGVIVKRFDSSFFFFFTFHSRTHTRH